MLTVKDMQARLAVLTYKPGWKMIVREGRFEGAHFVVTAEVEDAFNPGTTMTLDIHSSIPPMENTNQFYAWIQWRLCIIESHESREWLHGSNGKPLFDPHAEHAGRDL